MDSGNWRLINGSYKELALTNASTSHAIDANKVGNGVWLLSTNDVHLRFGDASEVATVADPMVPGIASPTPKDAMLLPKPKGAQRISVLAPDNTGTLRIWLAKRISR